MYVVLTETAAKASIPGVNLVTFQVTALHLAKIEIRGGGFFESVNLFVVNNILPCGANILQFPFNFQAVLNLFSFYQAGL